MQSGSSYSKTWRVARALMAAHDKLIAVVGPTAVGKTTLSIALARHLGTEIISGDSMLVYRGFDIGTAKPTASEMLNVRHRLIDILAPTENFSVLTFKALAEPLITSLNNRGHIPLLVGGTGLYVRALLEGYIFNEATGDKAYRKELTALAEKHGRAYVHGLLEKVAPIEAARLNANDLHRVIRALESIKLGCASVSREKSSTKNELVYDAYVIGLTCERAELYARINERTAKMFASGFVDEVAALLNSGVPRDAQAMQGIGYPQVASYLAGEISRAEAIDSTAKATRHFAKRQMTWYRQMPYIHWYDLGRCDGETALSNILNDLAGYFPHIVE